MKELETTGKKFERDESFTLDEYLNDAFGIWKDEPEKVRIWFAAEVYSTIRERVWHPSQKFEDQDDGSIILTMTVPTSQELVGWILYWGNFAKVLEPEKLKIEIQETLKKSLKNY